MDERRESKTKVVQVVENKSRPVDAPPVAPAVGQWYVVSAKSYDGEKYEWPGCVVGLGSNYIELKGPAGRHSWHHERVHVDEFLERCRRIEDSATFIREKIAHHQRNVRSLLGEASQLAALLGVGPSPQITDGSSETQALAIRSDEPLNAYRKALVKAKEKTLPKIFEDIKNENEQLSGWMKAELYPLEAQVDAMEGVVDIIKNRIFSVELYAGLVEQVKQIAEGKPAALAEPLTMFQRLAFMDEECLAQYQTGGMDINGLKDFDEWIAKPENMKRLLPFPRCLIAFRVRREEKKREFSSLFELIGFAFSGDTGDKYTFLYIRNGEQLFRLRTGIEFEEKLFPDIDRQNLDGDLWAKTHHPGWDIISNSEYVVLKEQYDRESAEYQKKCDVWESMTKKEQEKNEKLNPFWHHIHSDVPEYVHFTNESVHYDDIHEYIKGLIAKHNRLVLILQGLFDRSPILHPHPPWKLWTNEGFHQALRLVYDDSRALTAGEKPDFEAYRTRLNATIKAGTHTVGQEEAWEVKMAEKENKRMRNDYRSSGRVLEHTHFRPYDNPGPGRIAIVVTASKKRLTYRWTRKRQTYRYYGEDRGITAPFSTASMKEGTSP